MLFKEWNVFFILQYMYDFLHLTSDLGYQKLCEPLLEEIQVCKLIACRQAGRVEMQIECMSKYFDFRTIQFVLTLTWEHLHIWNLGSLSHQPSCKTEIMWTFIFVPERA